ncbi:MAG: hypothetical protein COV46_02450 [Deltaproteobacteria bacterium CG11_big_fil_rev_8_21_14_0_20_49_13]|nr:MAG: hypothetical protein COV46_02450 [Deltaproteobacteria bacterium CG11_big_fil_rev_8_21_14_0_20_49_13]
MTVIQAIHHIGRLVFTTREIAGLTSGSMSSTTQSLKRLEQQKVIKKIFQGVWAFAYDKRFSPFLIIPYLMPNHRAYLSFISALHIHGVIGQIPQVITVASTGHTKVIKTPVGTFDVHQMSPDLFAGFDWDGSGGYLLAEPEKAFVDCLYLASRKGRRFGNFPEINTERLDQKLLKGWMRKINDKKIRSAVLNRAQKILSL